MFPVSGRARARAGAHAVSAERYSRTFAEELQPKKDHYFSIAFQMDHIDRSIFSHVFTEPDLVCRRARWKNGDGQGNHEHGLSWFLLCGLLNYGAQQLLRALRSAAGTSR